MLKEVEEKRGTWFFKGGGGGKGYRKGILGKGVKRDEMGCCEEGKEWKKARKIRRGREEEADGKRSEEKKKKRGGL